MSCSWHSDGVRLGALGQIDMFASMRIIVKIIPQVPEWADSCEPWT